MPSFRIEVLSVYVVEAEDALQAEDVLVNDEDIGKYLEHESVVRVDKMEPDHVAAD